MNTNAKPGERMLAGRYINEQLNKLIKHLQGARLAEDSEDVHQVRVSCRRMRAAIRLFEDCFDKKLVSDWQKQTKKLLKSFGRARDLDVQIAFLAQEADQQKKMRSGIRRMLLRRRQAREAVQSNVIKAIDTIEKKQTLTNIHLEMEKSLFLLKSHTSSVQNADVYPRAYEQIRDHVGELMARCTAIENPDDYVGHHKMRITAKKLRYVMEICNEAMDDALKPAIKTIKKLQMLLGDMHDCDIWDSEIDRFIEQERQRTIEFYDNARPFSRILPGLEYLKSDRQAERRRLHQQAHELVITLERDAFWQGLLETLQQTYLQEDTIDKDPNDKQTQPITSTNENTEHRDPV